MRTITCWFCKREINAETIQRGTTFVWNEKLNLYEDCGDTGLFMRCDRCGAENNVEAVDKENKYTYVDGVLIVETRDTKKKEVDSTP